MYCDLCITTNTHANQRQPEHTPATVKDVPGLSQEAASKSPTIEKKFQKKNDKNYKEKKTWGRGELIHPLQGL